MVAAPVIDRWRRIGRRCKRLGDLRRPSSRRTRRWPLTLLSTCRPCGHPNRSRDVWLLSSPTMRRCGCRTRRSISRSTCKAAVSCARNWLVVCGPVERSDADVINASSTRTGKIAGMVNISERPAEVEDRAVPGHWEGDLIIGAGGRSSIGTLVERTHPFRDAVAPPQRTQRRTRSTQRWQPRSPSCPPHWSARSPGTKAANWPVTASSASTPAVDIYFCDPHSPWQRGSNENTNGLLRQYFPKGTNLNVHDAAHLNAVADQLNGRPRKTLDWRTPAEQLATLLDAIAA